ncbi:MAG: EAL domain-containing protein [Pseudolabrys sp.]|nr:EAL domain-containing protein [Pseudolabrys sp.]
MAKSDHQQDRRPRRLYREDGRVLRRRRVRQIDGHNVRGSRSSRRAQGARLMNSLLQNAPIRVKAFAASSVLLIFLAALGALGFLTAGRTAHDLGVLSSTNLPKQHAIAALNENANAVQVKVSRFATWASNGANAGLLAGLSSEIFDELHLIGEQLVSLGGRADVSTNEHGVIATLMTKWEKYIGAVDDTLNVGLTDAPMATMMLGGTDDDFQKIAIDLRLLAALVDAQTREVTRQVVSRAERNRLVLAIGAIVGVLLSIVVTLIVGRSIVTPLQAITKAMRDPSLDSSAIEAAYRDRTDEVGQMVKAISGFRQSLNMQNLQLDTALNSLSQGLCMFDADRRVTVCNDRFAQMYGLSPERHKPGTALRDIVEQRIEAGLYAGASADAYRAEQLLPVTAPTTANHELSDGRSIVVNSRPMANGGWVTTHEDISERRRAERRIAYMAHHDALTDLPNRLRFHERLESALKRIPRGATVALLCLDLDRFKSVNDTLGHPVGDNLLRQVADRLRNSVRESDTVARLGGDEFAIVQTEAQQPEAATALAQRLINVLSEPYLIDGFEVVIGASVGMAIAPADGTDADHLLKNGDLALYRAKSDGRGTYRFFEPDMDARMQARSRLEFDLRRALAQNEFEVFYQPVINVKQNAITGFEALLRWRHPQRGMVPPEEFIPLAEETGLIVPLGEWVMQRACRDAAAWPAHVAVSVNLSPVQFRGRKLLEMVMTALTLAKLPANRLVLEITEGVLLVETEPTLALLYQLRSLGVRIALDDFGTGYSSLSYLRSFPFDKIKIASSFIRDITTDDSSVAIIRAVIGLSASIGMETTAEGIETHDQLNRIRAEGCTEVQGFLFSDARPAADVAGLLRLDWAAEAAA